MKPDSQSGTDGRHHHSLPIQAIKETSFNAAVAEAKSRLAHPAARVATSLLTLVGYEEKHESIALRALAEVEKPDEQTRLTPARPTA